MSHEYTDPAASSPEHSISPSWRKRVIVGAICLLGAGACSGFTAYEVRNTTQEITNIEPSEFIEGLHRALKESATTTTEP